MTVTSAAPQALALAAGTSIAALLINPPLPALEVRILLTHALQLTRVQLITQSERALSAEEAQQLSALYRRRLQGEPMAYIVGEREFFGLPFYVNADVLIPRPDTELLVELALARLPKNGSMLDLGTGSGAIALAVAHTRPDVSVMALDVSEAALAVAMRNATRHHVRVEFLHSDWYAALTGQRFNLIAANPPYIVSGDGHLSQGDLRFEPLSALTDHGDGLSALRRITAGAMQHLAPGGWLLMEHGYDQACGVQAMLTAVGLEQVQSWKDLAGIQRVSGAEMR